MPLPSRRRAQLIRERASLINSLLQLPFLDAEAVATLRRYLINSVNERPSTPTLD